MKLRYLSSVASHQGRKGIDNNIALTFQKSRKFYRIVSIWLFRASGIIKKQIDASFSVFVF